MGVKAKRLKTTGPHNLTSPFELGIDPEFLLGEGMSTTLTSELGSTKWLSWTPVWIYELLLTGG